jgi:Glycosyltransferase family 87
MPGRHVPTPARDEWVRESPLRASWEKLARSEPWGTALVYAALVTAAGSISILLLAVESITPAQRGALVGIAIGAWALLVALGWTRGALPLRPLLAAIGVTLVLAVATPSNQSGDVYSYAMYGRIATLHHDNPFASYPMHFEGDPMRRHVNALWQRTPDIYGLGFTAIMAGLAPVIGESSFLVHFAYQLIAVAAVGAMLWLIWKRTRNPAALAFVGLNPLLAVSVVNGGHPDALVALGVLVGVLLAIERRPVLAGIAFALAASVNFTALVAAGVLCVWAYRRWTRIEVVRFAAIVAAFGALPYFLLSGWLQNAHEHSGLVSRQSIWNAIGSFVSSADALRTLATTGTTIIAGALLLVVVIRHTSRGTPELAIAAGLAVFLLASAWVMPWYAFTALPLLALRRPNLLSWTVAVYASLVLLGEQYPSLSASSVGSIGHLFLQNVLPVAAFVCCVVVIVFRPRDTLAGDLGAASSDAAATAAPTLAASA